MSAEPREVIQVLEHEIGRRVNRCLLFVVGSEYFDLHPASPRQ